MPSSCGDCSGWTGSLENVLAILNGEWSACEDCAHKEVMRVVVRQYQLRQPQWWVVGGRVVIPMWMVERLRNCFRNG